MLKQCLSKIKITKNRKKFIEYLKDFNFNLLNAKIIEHAFYYLLNKYTKIKNISITFKYSNKLKKAAGTFKSFKNNKNEYSYELLISKPIIKTLFNNNQKSLKINGLTCFNKLECFISIIEHEFVHFLMYYNSDSIKDKHSDKFKSLVYNLFGHTDFEHNLLDVVDDDKIKKLLSVNCIYNLFKNNQNIKKVLLIKINNKKALVKDVDSNAIYRIPYNMFKLEDC